MRDLTAVRRGQVFAVDGSAYFSRPGPRVIDGIELLAEILDPDAFDEVRAGRVLDADRRTVGRRLDAVPRELRLPLVRRRPHLPDPRRPRGLGAALPGLRRQGGRQRVPAVPAAPGPDRAWQAAGGPAVAVGDPADRSGAGADGPTGDPRPSCSPTTRPAPASTTTGTCAAAATSAVPIHDAAWNAELDAAGRWLDALPIRGEIVELAAGTGWWSPLLASKGELSLYDADAAPLDRARDRLVAHGLRAHLHVRDAWAEPDRQVDAVFTGFWLSHVPRARLATFLGARAALAQARRSLRLHRFAAAIRSRAPPITRRRPTTSRSAGSTTAASSRSSRSSTSRPSSRSRSREAGFAAAEVTTTGRFFLTGTARRPDDRGPPSAPTPAAILRPMSPLSKATIATVGSGVMAEAMIAGLLRGKLVEPGQVVASHPRAGAARAPRPRVRHPDRRGQHRGRRRART